MRFFGSRLRQRRQRPAISRQVSRSFWPATQKLVRHLPAACRAEQRDELFLADIRIVDNGGDPGCFRQAPAGPDGRTTVPRSRPARQLEHRFCVRPGNGDGFSHLFLADLLQRREHVGMRSGVDFLRRIFSHRQRPAAATCSRSCSLARLGPSGSISAASGFGERPCPPIDDGWPGGLDDGLHAFSGGNQPDSGLSFALRWAFSERLCAAISCSRLPAAAAGHRRSSAGGRPSPCSGGQTNFIVIQMNRPKPNCRPIR